MAQDVSSIGIGIVGGGYMGKAHAVAMSAVGAVFQTKLRPHLEMICARTPQSAEKYRVDYGFARGTDSWEALVRDPKVEAIIIATPPDTHFDIAMLALSLGKPVFCEKPLADNLEQSAQMAEAARESGVVNMAGFNYIRTPASRYARDLIQNGEIGEITFFRGEHTEDFYADPNVPFAFRATGDANGAVGDLAPHMINAALALVGPISKVMADVETVHHKRPGGDVTNDDHANVMCRFESGAMGGLYISRVATGRKMGYIYEIFGTKGSIRFNQEDQNALWLYRQDGPEASRGFTKILTGPAHPDYEPFCQGPGHGTGYQDQIIIEAKDFLEAIAQKRSIWPDFQDGHEVSKISDAILRSSRTQSWVTL